MLPKAIRYPDGSSQAPGIGIYYDPGPKPDSYPEGTGIAHTNVIYLPNKFEQRIPVSFGVCEFGCCPACMPDRPRRPAPHPALERPWVDRMRDAGFDAHSIPGCIWHQPEPYLYIISMVYWKLALHEGRQDAADRNYEDMLKHAPRRAG